MLNSVEEVVKSYKIACVVVTFNRKAFLKRCLDGICAQTFKPVVVYITDNASTDGTQDALKEWGYYKCVNNGIEFRYILNSSNEGSSGGQYLGIKTAHENGGYDGIWVMDDDGIPEKDSLAELVKYLVKYDYIAPIVLSDEDHRSCSFAVNNEDIETFIKQKNPQNGIIENWASPFNGILYSSRLVDKVGYPKREMFIWGDEANYHARCINAGFIPYTIIKAIHYHPLNRVECVTSLGLPISISNQDWKLYCCIRNFVYNELRVKTKFPRNVYHVIRIYLSYSWYFKKKQSLIIDAVFCGIVGSFSGLSKYMKK